MSTQLPYRRSEFTSVEPKYPFDLVVAYQDAVTCEQAERLYERIWEQLQEEYDFQVSWWGLDELGQRELREQAADVAARADMVMLSLRNGRELPPHTNIWIESWLARKEDHKSALVALVHERAASEGGVLQVQSQLQTVARAGQMDFFFHSANSVPELPRSLYAVRERANTITPSLEESMIPRFERPPVDLRFSSRTM